MLETSFGNEKVKTQLQSALDNKRLPQALLFYGPKGVGKKAFAISLATHLLEDRTHLIGKNAHPDLHQLSPKEQGYSIERIRSFCFEIHKPPFLAKKKVAIFHEADELSTISQNALLKTLEEPPLDTTFLFLTSNRAKILPTIISRTSPFPFQKPREQDLIVYLTSHFGISTKEAKRGVRLSGGSIQQAEAIAQNQEKLLP
ncbi:MAG: AAA family ATPase, partial [Chlamydiota bacterium]